MDFYKQLNYSLGNEDWNVERRALQIKSGDSVICVTASGDRPLHLLMTAADKIIAIDMNQTQNYLLALKLVAINELDYQTYLAFLGITPTTHRLDIFHILSSQLMPDARDFWIKNKEQIKKGIIYQGKIERITKLGALFLNSIRHKKIKELLSFDSLHDQREFIKTHWNTYLWKKLLSIFLNPRISKLFLKDPGLNLHIDYPNPGNYINHKIIQYLNDHLAKQSPLIQLILTGKITEDAFFPYLTKEGYDKIRLNTHRLHYQTDNIITFLNQKTNERFDAFSMSDIASYMPQPVFEQLLLGIKKTANANARFCLREFMSKRIIPSQLQFSFVRDKVLEEQSEKEEKNFVYRFMIGKIQAETQ